MKYVLCLLLVCSCAGAWAQEEAPAWNFDSDEAGKSAKGFSNETGAWVVTKDDSAPSKPNVLAQTAKSPKPDFNICLVTDSLFKDLTLSVKFKAIAGEIDQGGGLMWRAKDAKNYYLARFNPLENNFHLYSVVDGKRKRFAKVDLKVEPGWHTLGVVMKGNKIECSLDGKKYLEAADDTFKDAGKIGLWSKADAQTHFDDLRAVKAE